MVWCIYDVLWCGVSIAVGGVVYLLLLVVWCIYDVLWCGVSIAVWWCGVSMFGGVVYRCLVVWCIAVWWCGVSIDVGGVVYL